MRCSVLTSMLIVGSMLSTAAFASDPGTICEATKLGTVAKYDSCRLKADSKAKRASLPPDYSKCSLDKFDIAETKAAGECPTAGDKADMQEFVDACTASVAEALEPGGALPLDVLTCNEDLTSCQGDLSTTNADLGACQADLGTATSGTASVGDVLTGKSFTSSAGLGSAGTMPNNGAVTLTPGSSDQAIAAGYHDGTGKCVGDSNLVAGNIKSGTTLFGVAGSVTQATGAATDGQVLSGISYSNLGGASTGTMPDNGGVTLTPTTSNQAIAAGYHDGSGNCAGDADLVAGNVKSGVNLFGITGTLASGPARTGQTTCYDSGGSVIACGGTKQDGDIQKGIARTFTDNGDGTITDNATRLMWEKLSDDGSIHDIDNGYTWANAIASKAATLNSTSFAGYTDWRVPNVVELESLKNFGAAAPAIFSAFSSSCTAGCTVLTCSCSPALGGGYWTSSSYKLDPSRGWNVSFYDSYTGAVGKGTSAPVRAVRGGS